MEMLRWQRKPCPPAQPPLTEQNPATLANGNEDVQIQQRWKPRPPAQPHRQRPPLHRTGPSTQRRRRAPTAMARCRQRRKQERCPASPTTPHGHVGMHGLGWSSSVQRRRPRRSATRGMCSGEESVRSRRGRVVETVGGQSGRVRGYDGMARYLLYTVAYRPKRPWTPRPRPKRPGPAPPPADERRADANVDQNINRRW